MTYREIQQWKRTVTKLVPVSFVVGWMFLSPDWQLAKQTTADLIGSHIFCYRFILFLIFYFVRRVKKYCKFLKLYVTYLSLQHGEDD